MGPNLSTSRCRIVQIACAVHARIKYAVRCLQSLSSTTCIVGLLVQLSNVFQSCTRCFHEVAIVNLHDVALFNCQSFFFWRQEH